MAVVQISRIQIRRGKATTGTGFPQLASGEMGWAVDTQELYIGNGSVAEGAPAVGNTKILTENNLTTQGNILTLIQHIYRKGDNIQTGSSVNFPISRSLQDRLDDRVSAKDFGTVGDGVADDTAALQRAIDQLFLNPAFKASLDTTVGINARITLEIPAGRYKTTSTLYVPSYATLVGHGSNKTIIEYSGTGPAIQFINDSSTITSRVLQIALDDSGYISDATLAPKFVSIKGLTVSLSTINSVGLQLDAVRDSSFENIIIKGAWGGTPTVGNYGIYLKAASTVVTCEKNYFKKISVVGFTTAVYSKTDIINNTFKDCFINDVRQGFVLRETDPSTTIGQQFGPRNTEIENCDFDNVKQHAVFIGAGSGNTIISANFINVGNDGGSSVAPTYPQVYFRASNNAIKSFKSDRTPLLSLNTATATYIPEVGGLVSYEVHSSKTITLSGGSASIPAFRLPTCTNQSGGSIFSNPDPRHITYVVNYTFRSPNYNYTRRGTLTISVDIETGYKQLTDDYDFAGVDITYSPVSALSTQLDFSVGLLDRNGNTFTGSVGQRVGSIVIYKSNPLTSDTGYFTYTYTATA